MKVKRIYINFWLSLLISLFLSNCKSTQISSYNSLESSERLTKVLFIIQYMPRTKDFSNAFCEKFLSTLLDKGVTSEHYIMTHSDSTEIKEMNKRISKANYQFLIIMSQTEYKSYNLYGPNGGRFGIKMFRPNSTKHIWKANLEVQGDWGIRTTADKAVKNLVERLENDGFL